jgi:hypothetical protein
MTRTLLALVAAAVVAAAAPAPAHARATVCRHFDGVSAGRHVVATVDVWGSTTCAVGRDVAHVANAAGWPARVRVRAHGRRVTLEADVLVDTARRFEVIYYGVDDVGTINVRVRGRSVR